MRFVSLFLAALALAAFGLPRLFAHTRQTPPTPAEIAWSRATMKWDKLNRDARNFLPPRPPAPAGVTDLEFTDFYGAVIGDRGLELTAKVRALAGQQVRLVGFMVRQALPTPGVLLLAPQPAQVDEVEYGACDDLPPQIVRVFLPLPAGTQVPLTPGPLLLTGTLEVGQQSEPDGRNSFLRLRPKTPALTPLIANHPTPTPAPPSSPSPRLSSQP
ncbi:MAG: hypothetical protein WCG63_03785 [Opitutaceae bacterium]